MAQVGGLQELRPSKKVVGEYGQKWEWGETGETELLLFAGGGYYVHPTPRNSRGSGPHDAW